MSNTNQKKATNNIDEIDVVELFLQLLRKWYVFVISGVICIILGIIFILRTPSKYYTESSVLIKEGKNLSSGFGNIEIGGISSDNLLNTTKTVDDELIVFKSKNIMTEMVSNLGLQTEVSYRKRLGGYHDVYGKEPLMIICPNNYYSSIDGSMSIDVKKRKNGNWTFKFIHKKGYKKTKEKYTIPSLDQAITTQWGEFRFIEIPEKIDPKYPYYELHYNIVSLKSRVDTYISNVNIDLVNKKSNAIKVSTTGNNIGKNELIVNKVVDLYNNDALSDKNKESIMMSNFITKRIESLNKELDTIETSVEQYRRQNNIASMGAQSQLAIESSGDYNKQITSLEISYSTLSFIEEYINNSDSLALIPSNTSSTDDATLASMIVDYNNQIIEYLRITRSTNKENPFVVQLKTQITLNRQNILQTLKNLKESILMQKAEIEKQNNTLLGEIQNIPTIERRYIEIAREQGIKRNLYLYLLQRREEIQLALASTSTSNKIIDYAYTNVTPTSPNKKIILILAIFLSGIISLIYIYVESLINNKVESKKMLASLTKLPILGVVPTNKNNDQIVMLKHGHSHVAEMLRLLRSNIKFIFKQPGDKVILVTSTLSGEGKSFISSNLAVALAMINKKVILVGLDIRRPTLAKYLNIHEQPGVTNYLSESSYTINEIIQPSKYDNLDVCVAGPIPPNPSELLNNPRLEELIMELRTRYDYVILDSAPVGMIGDTFIFDSMADATIYVCRYKVTPKEHIKELDELVNENRLHNVSLVLNDIPEQHTYGYGKY